jgi:3-phenylpropionate/cinnamic acid dioxygenase small subunit
VVVLSVEDRLQIQELVHLHGHLMDAGAFESLGEIFTEDVVYDVSAFGLGELRGFEAIREAAIALGDRNPLGHHVTNVAITAVEGGIIRVLSKGIGVNADGTCGTVTYDDVVRRVGVKWRIARRRVVARRKPLHP